MKRLAITPGFWGAVGLLWLSGQEQRTLPLLAAVAAHEAGHLLALRALGAQVLSLRLGFLDARIETRVLSYRQELPAALAGPAASFFCGVIFSRHAPGFAAISLLLGAFNLLPVWPLDGGRALRAGLGLRLSPVRAERAALAAGLLTCALGFGGALWFARAYGAGMMLVIVWCVIFVRLARYGREEAIEGLHLRGR